MKDNPTQTPIPHDLLTKVGVLPIREGALRVAFGSPDGLSSNSWRIWTEKKGDVYIKCRDNFREVKVSLHASGRWRMGFTSEAVANNPNLVLPNEDRAWEVWDKPKEIVQSSTLAFRLLFPTSELCLEARNRSKKLWRDTIFIEAAPIGKVAVISIFITRGDIGLRHESEPSTCLASFDIGNGCFAKAIAHYDPEANIFDIVKENAAKARSMFRGNQAEIPQDAFGYFFGNHANGSRFIVGARIVR